MLKDRARNHCILLLGTCVVELQTISKYFEAKSFHVSLDYTIREFEDEDESQILNLLDQTFGRIHTRDYWRWKYFDNPLKKKLIVVAEINEQIIGCGHSFFREIKFGENMHVMVFGGDAAVHPNYRRMGIHTKMNEIKDGLRDARGYHISAGITTNPLIKRSRDKQGWPHFPRNIIEAIYVEDVSKMEQGFLKKAGYQVYKSAKKNLSPKIGENLEFIVNDVTQFGAEADAFWEKIKPFYSFLFKRDAANLNWRYCDNRNTPFKVFSVINQGELHGYCITLVKETGGVKTGYIIDLCTLPHMDDVVAVLLRKSVETLTSEVNLIKYWVVEGHPVLSTFHRFGFMSRPSNLEFRYRHSGRINDDIERFISASENKLFIQYGDTNFI